MIALSVLIGSLSNLQVTRSGIRSPDEFKFTLSDQSLWSYLPLIVEKKAIDDIVQGIVLSFFIGSS